MPETKLAAYEQEAMKKEKAQNDSTINAVTLQLDTVTAPAEPAVPDEIQNSANAYQQAQASLQDFYVPDYSQTEQVAELQARIDELEMQNAMAQQQTQQPNEMELLERSYQLAAQYMGNGNGNYQAPPQSDEKGKRNVQPVQNVTHNVEYNRRCHSRKPVRNQRSVGEVENNRTDVDRQQAYPPEHCRCRSRTVAGRASGD